MEFSIHVPILVHISTASIGGSRISEKMGGSTGYVATIHPESATETD